MRPRCSRCSRRDKQCLYKSDTKLINVDASFPNLPTAAIPATSTTNILELIDDDISTKMDQVISFDEILNPFVTSPYNNPDLASRVDYSLLQTPYGGDHIHPTRDHILHSDTIYQFPLECFLSLKNMSHKRYFDTFFIEFSEILMPLRSSIGTNIIRDILIQYSMRKDYLYFAILASGARFLYRKTMFEEDQKNCAIFMRKTLEMLNDLTFIQSFCKNPQDKVKNHIVSHTLEPLLLAILLLTSDNASSMTDNWRGHLKGAKELLRKVFVDEIFPKSKVLIFCKCWFTLFEVLAGMTAPYGGTLVKTLEIQRLALDVNSEYEVKILNELHIVRPDGFNFIFGFHNSLLSPLIKIIEKMKSDSDPSSRFLVNSEFVFPLISELNQCGLYNVRGSETGFSWSEAVHHSHVQAALLMVMTRFLQVPSENIVVQELTDSILNTTNSGLQTSSDQNLTATRINYPEFNLMMVQWPLLTAGLNSVTADQQYKVETMFRLLAEWGSGSAKFALDKIRRAWNNEHTQGMLEVDIVTY
jgi:hypothetical protein